ncbi:MAG TPA: ATP synthase F0 subunit B [Polyangia bacterium]|jgi:F-type H+-transporting ATPase subunit b|nr:ATP synthase F0 subunit B [Polyangia bacterium]
MRVTTLHKMMRGAGRWWGLGLLLGTLTLGSAAAWAQEGGEHGERAAAGEAGEHGGHGGEHGEGACTAESSDEECLEYWEHHINWWDTDYKKGPEQLREHRHMPPPFGMALINFCIFAFIMYRLAGQPLMESVRTRHLKIKKDLDEAAELRQAAAAKLKEYESRLAAVDAEVNGLINQLRAEAEAEKTQLIAQAEVEAERIRRDAESQIATEMLRIRRELRREVVEAAMATARKVLAENTTPEDQRRLAEQYLRELAGMGSEARS